MKKFFTVLCLATMLTFVLSSTSRAGEVDVLLEKLVEKGVLTPNEAKIIAQETKTQVSKEVATGQSYALPDWVQTIRLKGDIRLRYQYEKSESSDDSRNRGRTRFRMGFEFKPVKNTTVSAGIASGGTDPRSTNVTWENTFERPDLRLDYAAIEYQAAPWVKVIGGKFIFTDYYWQTTDMTFDTDINPYGFAAHFDKGVNSEIDAFANVGSWILDENGATDAPDPYMLYLQGGLTYKGEMIDAKLAGTYTNFMGVKGYDLDNELNTNTQLGGVADAGLQYDYDAGGLSAEVGFTKPFGGLPFNIDERIAVFGDYVVNVDPDTQNTGWAWGTVFGNAKVADRKQWQVKYQYVYLGRDAVLDVFPDSDRLGGRTDVKSHEIIMTVGLMKNMTFGVDFYQSDRIKGARNKETLVQGDLNVKF